MTNSPGKFSRSLGEWENGRAKASANTLAEPGASQVARTSASPTPWRTVLLQCLSLVQRRFVIERVDGIFDPSDKEPLFRIFFLVLAAFGCGG